MTEAASPACRITGPQARAALRQITQERGGCVRAIQLRRTNLDTGEVTQVLIPCGATLESACPACAKRAQSLRAEQCREGWHLEDEPATGPRMPDGEQEFWLGLRARPGRAPQGRRRRRGHRRARPTHRRSG